MEYAVLGRLALRTADGRSRTLDSPKQRRLLAVLLVHAGRTVAAERLTEALWGDELPADPAGALQTHVSRLRRLLVEEGAAGGDADASPLTTEPGGYRLDLAEDITDAARFEELLAAARAAEPAEAVALAEEALGLWRGAAYGECAELPAVRPEADRLEELRTAARELGAEALIELGRPDDALGTLERLVARDPYRERPRELLMSALYRSGRQSEALGHFQEFRRLLSEELGLEPSPGLRELERRILRHELEPPLEAGPDRPAPAAQSPPAGAPEILDGPQLEISYLNLPGGRRIAWAAAGEGPVLVVIPAFATNLGTIAQGRDPRSELLARLARSFRLVLWDRHGTGLSTEPGASRSGAPVELPPLTDLTEMEAVLERALDGAPEPLAVLGISCAGPIAASFAAHRPERVSRAVFLGTFADGPSTFHRLDVRESISGLVRAHWGLGSKILTDMMFPATSVEAAERYACMQREASTPAMAAAILEQMWATDVRDLLPRVEAPSLVIHYTGDRAIPFAGGQDLATRLPRARLVPLDGAYHLPARADLDRVTDLIVEFARS